MSFLLDTMVISETSKRRSRQHGRAQAWLNATVGRDTFISVGSVCEIGKGIERARRRDQHLQASALERWLRGVLVAHRGRVISVDIAVAEEWGRLLAGTPTRPVLDALIAATAAVHDMTVVTRNIDHFSGTGVRVLNPYATDPA